MNKNKQKWISDKIKKLKSEGKSQEQSVAIAYSTYNQMLKGGTYEKEITKYQEAGTIWEDHMNQLGFNPQTVNLNTNMVWDANAGQYKQRPTSNNQTFFTGNPLTGDTNTYQTKNVPYIQPNTIMINPSELDNISSERQKEQGVQMIDMAPYKQTVDLSDTSIQGDVQTPNYNRATNTNQQTNNVMFNPFGDISLEASLAYAGQGFGSGQTGKGLLGSTLAGLKGARTFMSGFATGKEEDRLQEEYRRNMQEEPVYRMSYQEGGDIKYTDEQLKKLNDASGLGFTKEGAQRFDPLAKPMEKTNLDLGKYSAVDYFDILQQENGYIIKPSINNTKGFEEYRNDLLYIQKLNPNINIQGLNDNRYYIPYNERKKEGGEITNSELLTQEYLVEDEYTNILTNNKITDYKLSKDGLYYEVEYE